jgi:hypothetical protein
VTPMCSWPNALYEQQRQRWTVPPFVAVGRARTHVRELVAGGMTVAQIARRADLGAATINRLIGSGRCGGAASRRAGGQPDGEYLCVVARDVEHELRAAPRARHALHLDILRSVTGRGGTAALRRFL